MLNIRLVVNNLITASKDASLQPTSADQADVPSSVTKLQHRLYDDCCLAQRNGAPWREIRDCVDSALPTQHDLHAARVSQVLMTYEGVMGIGPQDGYLPAFDGNPRSRVMDLGHQFVSKVQSGDLAAAGQMVSEIVSMSMCDSQVAFEAYQMGFVHRYLCAMFAEIHVASQAGVCIDAQGRPIAAAALLFAEPRAIGPLFRSATINGSLSPEADWDQIIRAVVQCVVH